MKTLAVVGGGKMGAALAGGMIKSNRINPNELVIVEPSDVRRNLLENLLPRGILITENLLEASNYVVATKPNDVKGVLKAIARLGEGSSQTRTVISIAAGVPLRTIQDELGSGFYAFRVMPNTPATLAVGFSAISCGEEVSALAKEFVLGLFQGVGQAAFVKEHLMDAVTAISGSGPAYLFLFAEALEDAALSLGLPYELARSMVSQTLLGASQMYSVDPSDVRRLRLDVTSPGGTTAAACAALEESGFRSAVIKAVQSAMARAIELGKSS